jgi:two-component system, OmpR family, sensor histidine kinase VicK
LFFFPSKLLITDREHVLTAELRKNTTYNILEALGLTTYSNSKPTVQSYITLFESLWKQKQLIDELEESHNQLELANEEVKLHSKMQNEFINVAAHELLTPLQPILSLSDILRHETTGLVNPKQKEAPTATDSIIILSTLSDTLSRTWKVTNLKI